jgi:hypothetical protein
MARCGLDAELIARLARFMAALESAPAEELRSAFNHFMTHPVAMEVWSVPLACVDPARNQFRELVFEYT